MTKITATPSTTPATGLTARVVWHRPLLALAAAMAVLAVVATVGSLVDPRQITGVPLWNKPLLFAISVGIYALTLSWLLGMLTRFRRSAWLIGTISAAGLGIEMVIIVGVALAGTTSHFNVSTPLATALWGIMAVSIVVVWTLGVPVAILLFRTDLGDSARSLAIRAGLIIALIGMGLAFLMTGPQPNQIADYAGIVGAHTVGASDGGPGLPLVGWSTEAGDLRIPHFIGMHALQLIPLLALVLELLARRVAWLGSARSRFRVIWVAIAFYVGSLAVFTAQALEGESIAHPDVTIAVTMSGLVCAALVGVGLIARRSHRELSRLGVPRQPARLALR